MKAAVYYGHHDIRIEEVAAPGALAAGEVRVRPAFVGICGTDLHEYAEGPIVIPTTPHPLNGSMVPQILGHEFSAEVLEVGPGVTRVKVGDRCAVNPMFSCGVCTFCQRGEAQVCPFFCSLGLSGPGGGMSTELIALESQLFPLPDSVSLLQAAIVEPAKVAAYAIDRSKVQPGGSVLVVGGGPIGALSALYAHVMGVATILMSEPNPVRRKRLESLGVGRVIDPTTENLQEIVLESTRGIGVDTAIEAAGKTPAFLACVEAIRRQGVLVQAALHTAPITFDPMPLSLKDATIETTWCWKTWDWERIVDLIATGRFPVEKVVSATISIDDVVADGFEQLLDPQGSHVKVLVDTSL